MPDRRSAAIEAATTALAYEKSGIWTVQAEAIVDALVPVFAAALRDAPYYVIWICATCRGAVSPSKGGTFCSRCKAVVIGQRLEVVPR